MTTLLDSTIRRDAQLLRFGTYLKSEYVTPTMQGLSKDIPKLLVGYEELNKLERNKLAREIRNLVKAKMSDMFDSITTEMHELVGEESEFTFDLYDDFVESNFTPVVAATAVKIADNAILSLEKGIGRTVGLWGELTDANMLTAIKEVDAVVRDGFRGGRTLQAMMQDLRGTYNRSTKKYMGGVLNTTNANRAETLIRTGVSHYANRARDEFANKNKSILDEGVFFATLDNRTTTICLSLHLNRYKNDDPNKPVLPLHYNERSVYLFAGKGIDPVEGTRPIVSGQKGKEELFDEKQSRTDKKLKINGRKNNDVFEVDIVSAKVTTKQFLDRQPRWFIESLLGKTQAKLYLDGGLPIDKFNALGGRPLTLKELKQTAAGEKAFRRAGID